MKKGAIASDAPTGSVPGSGTIGGLLKVLESGSSTIKNDGASTIRDNGRNAGRLLKYTASVVLITSPTENAVTSRMEKFRLVRRDASEDHGASHGRGNHGPPACVNPDGDVAR